MGTYLARRLLHTVLIVWGGITVLFLLVQLMPGDVIDTLIGSDRVVNPTVRRNLERLYGLDQPMWVQYGKQLRNAFTFDFGVSYRTNQNVMDMLGESIVVSGRVAFWAIGSYSIIGVAVGVLAAARRHGLFDSASAFISVTLLAFPPFVMGLLLQYTTGVLPFKWGWPRWAQFPVQWDQGKVGWLMGIFPRGSDWKYLLPVVITLSCVNLGSLTRLARTTMLEVLRADYMRTASAKGLSRRTVIFKHGLRNALVPVVTSIGSDVPNVFGFAILTEAVWNIPGMGGAISQAALAQDVPVLVGFCSVIIVVTAVASLIVDFSYGLLDPRIRVAERHV